MVPLRVALYDSRSVPARWNDAVDRNWVQKHRRFSLFVSLTFIPPLSLSLSLSLSLFPPASPVTFFVRFEQNVACNEEHTHTHGEEEGKSRSTAGRTPRLAFRQFCSSSIGLFTRRDKCARVAPGREASMKTSGRPGCYQLKSRLRASAFDR